MYRWVDHTGELELEIEADSEAEVFAEATSALGELLREGSEGHRTGRTIAVRAPERDLLLARWLDELVFHAETEGLVPRRLTSVELDGDGLRAIVEGDLGTPPHLVKAVTHHRLAFERAGDRWRARVVLDV